MSTGKRLRLLCVPAAGGSELSYLRWQGQMPSWLEVRPVALPGRGGRLAEAPVDDCDELVGQLWRELRPTLCAGDLPYALFGHSMGAVISYELALRAQIEAAPAPVALFASGSTAPSCRRVHPAWSGSDLELLGLVRELGGTPAELLDDPEWRELLLPALRADFKLCANYRPSVRQRLGCPIYVLTGDRDPATADAERVAAWCAESTVGGELRSFRGGHFYLHDEQHALLQFISGTLRSLRVGARAAAC